MGNYGLFMAEVSSHCCVIHITDGNVIKLNFILIGIIVIEHGSRNKAAV